jgi:hypothetical protein
MRLREWRVKCEALVVGMRETNRSEACCFLLFGSVVDIFFEANGTCRRDIQNTRAATRTAIRSKAPMGDWTIVISMTQTSVQTTPSPSGRFFRHHSPQISNEIVHAAMRCAEFSLKSRSNSCYFLSLLLLRPFKDPERPRWCVICPFNAGFFFSSVVGRWNT